MAFSTFLKNIRTDSKMTQAQMAEVLDISVNAVKLIENGSTKFPGDKVLQKLCDKFDMSPLDVITEILFNGEDYKDHPKRYLACRYQGYMYLQNWNVEKSPYVVQVSNFPEYTFDGLLTKKRNLKNKVLVTSLIRHLPAYRVSKFADDLNDGLAKMMFGVMWTPVPIKAVHMLFDSRYEAQSSMYKVLSELRMANVNIDIIAILFDPDKGELLQKQKISMKKVPEDFTEIHDLFDKKD